MAREFEIEDLGKLKYLLEIEMAHSCNGNFISQQKYILDILKEIRVFGCKLLDTPIEQNHKLGEALEHAIVNRYNYQGLAGRFIYLGLI